MKVTLAVLFVFLGSFVGYDLLSRKITVIVPDDFKGFINIVGNSESENELSVSLTGIQIRVPPSGRIEFKSIDKLRKWGVQTGEYVSGRGLEVFIPQVTDGDFGMWMLGVPAGERLYYFVGTREEMAEFTQENQKEIFGAPPVDPAL